MFMNLLINKNNQKYKKKNIIIQVFQFLNKNNEIIYNKSNIKKLSYINEKIIRKKPSKIKEKKIQMKKKKICFK